MVAGAEQGRKYCDAHRDENWMFGFLEAQQNVFALQLK